MNQGLVNFSLSSHEPSRVTDECSPRAKRRDDKVSGHTFYEAFLDFKLFKRDTRRRIHEDCDIRIRINGLLFFNEKNNNNNNSNNNNNNNNKYPLYGNNNNYPLYGRHHYHSQEK